MNFINPYDYLKNQEVDPYTNMNDDERMKAGCLQGVIYVLAVAVAMLICSLFTSCKSIEYVPVIDHKTDTLIQTKVQHDSIYINDSTVITEKGDTVRIEKWHTKYVQKEVHDTTYVSKTDTIPQPYPVTEYVEKHLAWWQEALMWAGAVCIVFVGVWIFKKLR